LESGLLAAGALGFLCADATAVTAAAGDGNSASGGRHCDGRCCWLLIKVVEVMKLWLLLKMMVDDGDADELYV
jgi:hypothetical protein